MSQDKISGIYALLDPVTEEIRYIGCSADIHMRWINHCKIQTCEKFRKDWLVSLQDQYGTIYPSVKAAAEFFGFTPSNITYHLRANTPIKGYLLKRIM